MNIYKVELTVTVGFAASASLSPFCVEAESLEDAAVLASKWVKASTSNGSVSISVTYVGVLRK